MTAFALNLVIGLVSSLLSGTAVLVWNRVKISGLLHRKAALFGLVPGGSCLIVLNENWKRPGTTSHEDVHTAIAAAALAREAGCEISMEPATSLSEANGERTEFCLGGPLSNPRSRAYLSSQLPGVVFKPLSARRDSGAIVAGGSRFLLEPGHRDFAIVAKFTPARSRKPVLLICGQTSIANRASLQFLEREHRNLARSLASIERFCLVLRVDDAATQGIDMTRIAADVGEIAFSGSSCTGTPV